MNANSLLRRKALKKPRSKASNHQRTLGAPHLARILRDVGYHGTKLHASKDESRVKSYGDRAVVSHISRKTSEMWGTRRSLVRTESCIGRLGVVFSAHHRKSDSWS